MIRAAVLAAMLLSLPARADVPPVRAELDCGTLRGVGVVTVIVGLREIVVPVECGRSV